MNQDYKIYCPKCGNEMNSNSRYCMKCGFLNANNEANQNMQAYIPTVQNTSYQILQVLNFIIIQAGLKSLRCKSRVSC